jgi:hypothetical protein
MIDQITTAHTALKKSRFLSRFKLTDKDLLYIQTKGIDTIRSNTIDFIKTRLTPAPAFPKNDGNQTPMRGHPVFIAQHATATCCRGCMWKWHRVEKGRPLTDDEIRFCGRVGDGVNRALPTVFPTQLTVFFLGFLPGFTWVTILGVGNSVGKKKKGLQ